MENDTPPAPAAPPQGAMVQEKPGQPTTHVRNTLGELIAWDTVREALLVEKLAVREAAARFNLKDKTIYERAHKKKWKIVHAAKRRAREKLAKRVSEKILKVGAEGMDWGRVGETHRSVAFQIAHASVAKFKPRAPKNFRELEAADKIARRAAGLEVADVASNTTLIQVNELINESEPQVLEAREVPLEAEVIEDRPASPEDASPPSDTTDPLTLPASDPPPPVAIDQDGP